jgi:ribosomal-protein-serine acetyltransferase
MNKILIDLPEKLETNRLILQIPKAGFGKKLHEAMADGYDDYVKWLLWPEEMPTIEQVEQQCREQHASFILRELIRYLIIDKDTNKVVGATAFPVTQLDWRVPQFGIAYFIRKTARSKGYAIEATHAMTLLAFRVMKARKVQITCDADNISSIKIPLGLGFNLEYTQRGGFPRADNVLVNLQTYSLFSESELIFNSKVYWQ